MADPNFIAILCGGKTNRRIAIARPARTNGVLATFDQRLPFELTAGQQAVAGVIAAELARPHPMHRLLQGEVGSGKTVVALRAMLSVVDSGGQAALLAPTEVLAQQHLKSWNESELAKCLILQLQKCLR